MPGLIVRAHAGAAASNPTNPIVSKVVAFIVVTCRV